MVLQCCKTHWTVKVTQRVRLYNNHSKEKERKTRTSSHTASVMAEVDYAQTVHKFFSHEIKEETKIPIKTKISGSIPEWLTGNLIRVGPGKFTIGPNKFKHWFDGYALLHRFSFNQGSVCYQNQFLESKAYLESLEKTYIARTEFGTSMMADPCKSLYHKFMAWFDPKVWMTDNCNINIIEAAGELWSSTETSHCYNVDKESLKTGERIEFDKRVPTNTATAHPHTDKDGNSYNVGTYFLYKSMYEFFKVSPRRGPDSQVQVDSIGTLIASYPYPSYYHSFGMTENYLILVEQPLFINLLRLGFAPMLNIGFEGSLYFDDRKKTVIRVFSRKTGKNLVTKYKYTADPFFVFHHINAFEETDHIVFDLCGYDDPSIIKKHYFSNMESESEVPAKPTIRRFVLPLKMEGSISDDLNRLSYTSATAVIKIDGSVHCTPEIIVNNALELPRINYDYNGKNYRYVYCIGEVFTGSPSLTKVNVEDKGCLTWSEADCFPSEPVFVPHPDGTEEDEGVVLSLVVKLNESPCSFLLVLDATTFTEIGRAEIEQQLPASIHGTYVS